MTTMDSEKNDDRGTTSSRSRSGGSSGSSRSGGSSGSSRSSSRSGSSSRRGMASGLAAGLSTGAILDIVDRLGLVDMIVDRVKGRLEEVDVDDLIDEIGDYLKRNPEVLVVSLGAVTIAAGALVYLNRRNSGGGSRKSAASRK